MRSIIVGLVLLLAAAGASAETPDAGFGIYRAAGHEVILAHLPDIDAATSVDFPSGRVRVLRNVDGAYLFGSNVGGSDDAGRIQILEDGITRTESTQVATLQRVALRSREVRFQSGDHQLGGSLTLPPGDGPFPAVVLLHGGGAQTRDFWWVAPFFAARGVAVLAYDKQGVAASTGNWQAAGLRGLAADAVAALRFVRSMPEIDARRVGFYGASNGGWVAPLAASDPEANPAFVIARSASALPELENVALEVASDLDDAGFDADVIAESNRLYRLRVRAVRSPTQRHWERYRSKVEQHAADPWFTQTRLPTQLSAWREENIPAIREAVGYWQRNWIEPTELWRGLEMPVLIQIGESDRSIPGPRSAYLLSRALRGNAHASVHLYEDADHPMFANASGRSRDIPNSQGFAAGYLTDLDAFIRRHILERRS